MKFYAQFVKTWTKLTVTGNLTFTVTGSPILKKFPPNMWGMMQYYLSILTSFHQLHRSSSYITNPHECKPSKSHKWITPRCVMSSDPLAMTFFFSWIWHCSNSKTVNLNQCKVQHTERTAFMTATSSRDHFSFEKCSLVKDKSIYEQYSIYLHCFANGIEEKLDM